MKIQEELEKYLILSKGDKNKFKSELKLLFQKKQLEICIYLLSKAFFKRTNFDITILYKCTKNIQFFKNQHKKVHERCCKYLKYQFSKRDEIIFAENTIGSQFFIILSGEVMICKNDKEQQEQYRQKLINEHLEKNEISENSMKYRLTMDEARNEINKQVGQNEKKIYRELKRLSQGDSFGELALIESGFRTATVICTQDTHLAVLEKEFFKQILQAAEINRQQQQIKFYQKVGLFDKWHYTDMMQVYLHFQNQSFIRGQHVYKQSDPPDKFYVVKSGQFLVQQLVLIEDLAKQNIEAEVIGTDITQIMCQNTKKYQIMDLAILGEGEYFGDEELFNYQPRLSSVICSSQQGVLSVMKNNEFMNSVKPLAEKYRKLHLDVSTSKRVQMRKQRINQIVQSAGKRGQVQEEGEEIEEKFNLDREQNISQEYESPPISKVKFIKKREVASADKQRAKSQLADSNLQEKLSLLKSQHPKISAEVLQNLILVQQRKEMTQLLQEDKLTLKELIYKKRQKEKWSSLHELKKKRDMVNERERVENQVIQKISRNQQRPQSVPRTTPYVKFSSQIRNSAHDYPTFKFVTLDELLDKQQYFLLMDQFNNQLGRNNQQQTQEMIRKSIAFSKYQTILSHTTNFDEKKEQQSLNLKNSFSNSIMNPQKNSFLENKRNKNKQDMFLDFVNRPQLRENISQFMKKKSQNDKFSRRMKKIKTLKKLSTNEEVQHFYF